MNWSLIAKRKEGSNYRLNLQPIQKLYIFKLHMDVLGTNNQKGGFAQRIVHVVRFERTKGNSMKHFSIADIQRWRITDANRIKRASLLVSNASDLGGDLTVLSDHVT